MGGGMVGKVLITLVALLVVYYVYQWLFGSNGLEGKQILNSIESANPDTAVVLSSVAGDFPALYEGGEYTINTWVYINDYSINRGQNKHILTIGGNDFATLVVFLGPWKNTLNVRVHTAEKKSPMSQNDSNLSKESVISMFTPGSMMPGFIPSKPCDVSEIDLQRWVQITVVLNGKIVDVYMDGKLARSCILPSVFKVNGQNLFMTVNDYRGFGGYISNMSAHNYALNPEQIWRLYMTGPGEQFSLMQYITRMFNPKTEYMYPKKNILG